MKAGENSKYFSVVLLLARENELYFFLRLRSRNFNLFSFLLTLLLYTVDIVSYPGCHIKGPLSFAINNEHLFFNLFSVVCAF